MRRLLVKLVAIETALLGWISYWLFLVYANNPSVSDQLGAELQRFPQLSFTTVDIAVLVIIGILSIILAFKFQRGLRPGMRLERALQMLENLMKRNLVLEAQVTELKIEKAQTGPTTAPAPLITPSSSEPKQGSWEKAFKTPLEAGPPMARASGHSVHEIPFEHERGVPPPRIEAKVAPAAPTVISAKPPIIITEKTSEKSTSVSTIIPEKRLDRPATSGSSFSSSWEDSPKFVGETKGILTPSAPPRKVPAVSESGTLRQPYIPAPAPKIVPPSVIVGAMSPSPASQPRPPPRPLAAPQASPRSSSAASSTRTTSGGTKSPTPIPIASPSPAKPLALDTSESPSNLSPSEPKESDTVRPQTKLEDQVKEKNAVKPQDNPKKKLPNEED